MSAVTSALDWATTAGLAALGAYAVARWARLRGRTAGVVAGVLGLLAATSILERVGDQVPGDATALFTLTILLFELSGLGLLLLRHGFLPLPRAALRLGLSAVAVSVGLFALVGFAPAHRPPTAAQWTAIVLLVAVWGGCVGEPMIRLWLASRGRPTVQRARLRALSTGYAAIFVVLILSAAPSAFSESAAVQLTVSVLGLLVVPLLCVSFAPPGWVRRAWRRAEDEAARQAIAGLLTFSTDPAGLAEAGLVHATRLVGADGGAVVTSSGLAIAVSGMDHAEAAQLMAEVGAVDTARVARLADGHTVVLAPLSSSEAAATLLVRAGPFTPLFGSDELTRMRDYAGSLGLAFDRVRQSARYRSFLQAVSDIGEGLVITEAGRPVYVNDAYLELTGYSAEELLSLPSLIDLAPPELREELATRLRNRLSGMSVPLQYVSQLVRKDGRRVTVENAVRRFESESQTQVIAIVRDVSERRRGEELRAMQFAVTRLLADCATIDDAAPELLRVLSTTLDCQAAGLWLMDPGEGALTLHTWWQLASVTGPEPAAELRGARAEAGVGVPGQVWQSRAAAMTADLTNCHVATARHASTFGMQTAVGFPIVLDDRVCGVIELFSRAPGELRRDLIDLMSDIGNQLGQFVERRRAERALHDSLRQLAAVASTDPLTGLRNRRDFDQQLASLEPQPFAILVIDVDNLKQINDEYGHEGGDVVLRGVSMTLAALIRDGGLVARVGGDEFAVLLVGIDAADARTAGERMRVAVQGVSLPYGQARITVGWALGAPGSDPYAVWRRADADLYHAKRDGRNRVGLGNAEDRRDQPQRAAWRDRVEGALEVTGMPMLYQPIVRLGDGAVVGHEALARPPGCGPTDSVELLFTEALHLGRLRDIDWMCRRAALESVPWPQPQGWAVFVNVRTVTLLDPVHDVDQMLMLLSSVGGKAEQVVLEITEHEIISDLNRLTTVLASYREQGFRFALDDVGEGHSTLELLAAAEAEYIKIAHRLTNSDTAGARSAIRAAVAFARSSGATVLAEGIENEACAERMVDFGIELGQGWHLGVPGALAPARPRIVRPRRTA